MKKKDKASVQTMTKEELGKYIKELEQKLITFRLDRYTKQVKNVREGKLIRHKLAVAHTILNQKELSHD